MRLRIAHLVLTGFSLFLLWLIWLADTGHGQFLFHLASRLPAGDKVGHLILFGIPSFLLNLILQARTTRLFGRSVLNGTAVLLALTTLEECSQLFFKSRTFDLWDLAAGALGIWLMGRAASHYLKWRQRPRATTELA